MVRFDGHHSLPLHHTDLVLHTGLGISASMSSPEVYRKKIGTITPYIFSSLKTHFNQHHLQKILPDTLHSHSLPSHNLGSPTSTQPHLTAGPQSNVNGSSSILQRTQKGAT
ncbi:uncharacterized protein LOC111186146 isoform X2 [Delphinapterus leucas]|uniref:Uncharacterized protein LOC111186146 isoform X2 n=1 Tax=Delphinapterus leucas TaxID=9749 RepID=A0A2Y9Q9G1_DELLE|nr:uncharacterized protein LOC111186146 isoform X2 [Delphinapterus leucas]